MNITAFTFAHNQRENCSFYCFIATIKIEVKNVINKRWKGIDEKENKIALLRVFAVLFDGIWLDKVGAEVFDLCNTPHLTVQQRQLRDVEILV